MTEREQRKAVVSIGTIAAGIDLAAAIIDNLVGDGITGNAKAGNVEAQLAGNEIVSLVATRMNTQIIAKHNLTPPAQH